MAFCPRTKEQKIIAGNAIKMTREGALFALKAMACDTQVVTVVKMLQENFGIKVSAGRLSQMKVQPSWGVYYDEFRHSYLANLGETTGIYIANRKNRLEIAQTLMDQIMRSDCDLKTKDKVEACLKVLKQAQGEMKEVTAKVPGSSATNVLQYIRELNIKQETEEEKTRGEVIEGTTIPRNEETV